MVRVNGASFHQDCFCLNFKVTSTYQIISQIGRGSSGVVYRASDRRNDAIVVALKAMALSSTASPSRVDDIMNEITVLRELNHRNIVKYIDHEITSSFVFLVTELSDGGTLRQLIQRRQRIEYHESKYLVRQLINGVLYLHEKGYIHRDLKSDNIVLDYQRDRFVLKIVDFGLAVLRSDTASLKKTETSHGRLALGSLLYMSPERIETVECGEPSDAWSIGVIWLEMITGTVPFQATTKDEIISKIISGPIVIPKEVEARGQDLLTKLLLRDPVKRMTARRAQEHVCFKTKEELMKEACDLLESAVERFRNNKMDKTTLQFYTEGLDKLNYARQMETNPMQQKELAEIMKLRFEEAERVKQSFK